MALLGRRRYEQERFDAPWWLVRRLVIIGVVVGWGCAIALTWLEVPDPWMYGISAVALLVAVRSLATPAVSRRRREGKWRWR